MVIVHRDRCIGCKMCVEVCPFGCFEIDESTNKSRVIDTESCIECGACILQCKGNAIIMHKGSCGCIWCICKKKIIDEKECLVI